MADLTEISQQVNFLAEKISSKNKELEKLKSEYTSKLAYLEQVESLYLKSIGQNTADPKLDINLKVDCKNCGATVYDAKEIDRSKNDYFILFPKAKINDLLLLSSANRKATSSVAKSGVNRDDKAITATSNKQSSTLAVNSTSRENQNKKHKKKVCSYCKKAGHSRAKCFKRLTTEKQD